MINVCTPSWVRCAMLGDDDILRPRLEFRPDGVIGRIDRRLVALGRGHQARTALRARVTGRIEDGKAGGARRRNSRLVRSEEHTSELQSLRHLVCRLLLEK